jgi:hypothetical protein
VSTQRAEPSSWISSASAVLTPRRLCAHAFILAICLWGVCAVDYATPGLFDRGGNIKFQDFLSFYISGKLIAQARASSLYDEPVRHAEMLAIAQPIDGTHESASPSTARLLNKVRLPNLYGPQLGLMFAPFARLSFLTAGALWAAVSSLLYLICVYAVWNSCPSLRPHRGIIAIAAIAFPPLFHFFVRGQLSALVLLCFTVAFLAMRTNRHLLAGIALGCLVLKPQFLVAIPLILLVTQSWTTLAGLIASAAAQLVLTRLYFGPVVMGDYINLLRHASDWVSTAELSLAPIQIHSLRSFWVLLLPWPSAVTIVYLLSSLAVIAIAAAIWKSSSPLALRFSALLLAAVLVNPHIYIYDLLALAPIFLLLTGWSIENAQHPSTPALRVFLYLSFLLPFFGPIARWTHLQLSVIVFVALLWTLHRIATAGHKLALRESAVV